VCGRHALGDPADRLDLVAPVNHRWLLRPVQFGAGRFHPKSYLSATARTAKLLVGSGNLTSGGLDGGREVFTVFSSGTTLGDAAIATWRMWMRRLVDHIDDVGLAERFRDLEERLPPSPPLTVVGESPLWHNLDSSFTDQFCEAVAARTASVDELIMTAPFYDENGEALGGLADRLEPTTVRIYTSTSTSVNGRQLAQRLSSLGASIEVFAYQPDRFTHAKLIGVTSGSQGWLLSGSANLSHAALTLTAGAGNVELAVLSALPADHLRRAFLPLDATAEPQSLESVTALTYESTPETEQERTHVTIRSASVLSGDRARVITTAPVEPGWRLADHQGSQPLNADGSSAQTVGPLSGPIVHIVDDEGAVISNRVVLDDPDALARILVVCESKASTRPAELTTFDTDSPLGEALLWLHQHMVMDVSEQPSVGGGGGAGGEEPESDDDDLWSRLERERLGRDPRAGIYRQFSDRNVTGLEDPLLELLDAMRHRAPIDGGVPPAPPFPRHPDPVPNARKRRPGVTWSTAARIRVRARNVLRRWASAQTDPRLSWVDPLAPLGNLRAIACTFVLLWNSYSTFDDVAELSPDDLDDLWYRWFSPCVGTGHDDGWLDRANLSEDQLARYLDHEFIENVTALCLLAVRHGRDYRERVIAWQATLQAALDRGWLDATADVADDISTIVGHDKITRTRYFDLHDEHEVGPQGPTASDLDRHREPGSDSEPHERGGRDGRDGTPQSRAGLRRRPKDRRVQPSRRPDRSVRLPGGPPPLAVGPRRSRPCPARRPGK
jgi:hypothetical protein